MMPLQNRSTAAAAASRPRDRLAAQLDGQQVDARVEPDDELAALALDCLGDPIGERNDRRSLVVRSDAHAAKATPFTAARIASRSSASDAQLGRRPPQERRDEEKLVGLGRLEVGREAPVDLGEARLDLEPAAASARDGAARDDAAGEEDRPGHPRLERGHDEAGPQRPQAPQLVDPLDHLLERGDPVAQPGGVLEAKIAGEPAKPEPQPGSDRARIVALEAVERLRRAARQRPARDRPVRRRLGAADPAGAASAAGRRAGRAACCARSPAAAARAGAAARRAPPRARCRTAATRPARARPSAASTAGRWRSPEKYERSRALRLRARPT